MLSTRRWVLWFVLASFALPGSAKDRSQAGSSEEKKFSGMVEKVNQHTCEICHCVETSITLKTATQRLEVRLGPKPYLDEHDFYLSRGDLIDITGLSFKVSGKAVVLAIEVRKGGETLNLRGKSGRPTWVELHGHTCPVCGN
jgi:hypothetical protein